MMLSNAVVTAVLAARDVARTAKFYRDVVGLPQPREVMGGVMFETSGGRFMVYESGYAGTAQNTVMSFTVTDIQAEVADLRGRGVVFEDYDFPGLKTVNGIASLGDVHSAWFKDPEGNIIALTQDIPA
ncbi:MAG: VOC family protein [Chloroflexota bacterium]|nr:VOC family protein [Chloroflexota bacterium]